MLRLILLASAFLFLCSASHGADYLSKDEVLKHTTECKKNGKVPAFNYTGGDNSKIVSTNGCNYDVAHKEAKTACEAAVTKYEDLQKAGSAFRKGCTATQKVARKRGDSKSCLVAANRCELCVGSAEDDEDNPSCQAEDSDEYDGDDSGVNGIGMLKDARKGIQPTKNQYKADNGEIREMKLRFENCPLFSKDELDEIIEARKNHEEGKEEGRKTLEDRIAELKAAKRELGDMEKEQSKLVPEYTEEFNKIISEQNQKLQDELKQTGDQIIDMILNLQTAEMQYIDAKNAIYKVCYDKAQQALDRLKADRNLKIRSGALRAKGGFSALIKQTSTEKRLEKFANSVLKNCRKKDTLVRQQIISAEKVYDQTLKRLNIQLDKLEAKQSDITNKLMDSVEDPEEKSKLDALKKQYEKKGEALAKQIAEKMEQVENLTVAVNRIQEELQKDEVLYAHYLEQESIVKKTGARSEKAITPGEFMEAASEYESALDSAATACECPPDGVISDAKKDDKYNKCDSIFSQMDNDFGDGEGSKSGRVKSTRKRDANK